MKTAQDIMTTRILTVTPETSVNELARLLTENNINGMPVIDDDGNLLGVVTENDLLFQQKKVHIPTVVTILDSVIYLESPDKMKEEMRKITGAAVADIYTKKVRTVHVDTPVDEVATLMTEKNIHTIPVMDKNKLVGVIGKRDIIKTIIS